jgi:hypothetical protein
MVQPVRLLPTNLLHHVIRTFSQATGFVLTQALCRTLKLYEVWIYCVFKNGFLCFIIRWHSYKYMIMII